MIIQLNAADLPRLHLPPLNGLIMSGPREAVWGGRFRVCPKFLPTGDASTLHARRAAMQPGMAMQSLVIHPRAAVSRSSAVAFLAGRRLLEHPLTADLPGPVVTSPAMLPPYAGDWRGVPLTVLLTCEGGEHRTLPMWELMSPARYSAWMSAGCP